MFYKNSGPLDPDVSVNQLQTNETQSVDSLFDSIHFHINNVGLYSPNMGTLAAENLSKVTEKVDLLQTVLSERSVQISEKVDLLQVNVNNTLLTLKTAQAENLRLETALQNLYDAVRPYVGDRLPIKVVAGPITEALSLLAEYKEARKC